MSWINDIVRVKLNPPPVDNGVYDRWWFISKPFPRGYTDKSCPGWRMTMSFFTQEKLLSNILKSRTAFIDGCNILRNPFYGMSRDEIALRMAVVGA